MDRYDYDEDEWPIAETETAGEIDPGAPFFAVSILETNSPVEVGETLEIVAAIENDGDADGSQEIELSIADDVVDAATVDLEPGETTTIDLEYETEGVESGEYTAVVSSENETAETIVTIDAPAEFVVTDLFAPDTGEAGQEVEVVATIANDGDLGERRRRRTPSTDRLSRIRPSNSRAVSRRT